MAIKVRRLPGPKLQELRASRQAELWSLRDRMEQPLDDPLQELLDVTKLLPQPVANELLQVLNKGLEAVCHEIASYWHELKMEHARPPLPAAALTGYIWLLAVEQALRVGHKPDRLAILLSVVVPTDEVSL